MPAASFWRIFSAASGEDGISPPEVSTWSEPGNQARGERTVTSLSRGSKRT